MNTDGICVKFFANLDFRTINKEKPLNVSFLDLNFLVHSRCSRKGGDPLVSLELVCEDSWRWPDSLTPAYMESAKNICISGFALIRKLNLFLFCQQVLFLCEGRDC